MEEVVTSCGSQTKMGANSMDLIFAARQLLGESGIPHPFSFSQGKGLALFQANKKNPNNQTLKRRAPMKQIK